jgi:hypothetical protein
MDLQDSEAIFRIVEGNALDRAREGLQGRSLIGLCGSEHLIHGACWEEFPASSILSLDGAVDEVMLLPSTPPKTAKTDLADGPWQARRERREVKA